MMEFILFLLPVLFIHLFGFFDACQTARKDFPYAPFNRIWKHIKTKDQQWLNWYEGGNEQYPPGNPFKCDFWHLMKHCWTLCISMAVLSAVLVTLVAPSMWELMYVFLYGVEGLSFTFYYSFVLRTDRNFKWYINHLVHPWEKQ